MTFSCWKWLKTAMDRGNLCSADEQHLRPPLSYDFTHIFVLGYWIAVGLTVYWNQWLMFLVKWNRRSRQTKQKSCINYSVLLSDIRIFTFISSPQRVYNEFTQWPTPSWLESSIGTALHRYRRGHGFQSRSSLIFFFQFRLSFRNCVYNCDDHLLIHSLFRS